MSEVVRGAVHRNAYRDSVELMGIAAELEKLPGIVRAGLVMATPANLAVLAGAGLAAAASGEPGPNDLIVAVAATDVAAADEALGRADRALAAGGGGESGDDGVGGARRAPETLVEGLAELPDATLALISTPGPYATAEALKALKHGLHVFLFSDNVSVEDEVELKTEATRRGLLVMGPDCGTAIVGGVPLGFANAIRRGPIGLAAASGTGLQQVSCLIDRLGSGVSHALGTGGRDLDERVGGRTMLAAIDRLIADPATEVVVLISKPPAASVAARVLDAVRGAPKPVVVNFLGGEAGPVLDAGAHPAPTFEAAARAATALARGEAPPAHDSDGGDVGGGEDARLATLAASAAAALGPGDLEIRGLFSGGSLAGEAKILVKRLLGPDRHDRILDLGDDEFTVGRPHPMIDPRLRVEHIVALADEPAVGVLLLDVVLGYGSHLDPAGALAPALVELRERRAAAGRPVAVVASVCGTEADPQSLGRQEQILSDAGVLLASSNARAARLAAGIAAAAREATGPAVAAGG